MCACSATGGRVLALPISLLVLDIRRREGVPREGSGVVRLN